MVCRFKGLNLTVNPLLTFRKNSPLYDFILAARVSCKYSDSSIVYSVYNYFIYLIELKVCMSYNREFRDTTALQCRVMRCYQYCSKNENLQNVLKKNESIFFIHENF